MNVDWEQSSMEASDRQRSWSTIVSRLSLARDFVQEAQCKLDEIDQSDFAEALQPLFDDLRRAVNDLSERTE